MKFINPAFLVLVMSLFIHIAPAYAQGKLRAVDRTNLSKSFYDGCAEKAKKPNVKLNPDFVKKTCACTADKGIAMLESNQKIMQAYARDDRDTFLKEVSNDALQLEFGRGQMACATEVAKGFGGISAVFMKDPSNPSKIPGLTGPLRDGLIKTVTPTCFQKLRELPKNTALTDVALKSQCGCAAEVLADSISEADIASARTSGQKVDKAKEELFGKALLTCAQKS